MKASLIQLCDWFSSRYEKNNIKINSVRIDSYLASYKQKNNLKHIKNIFNQRYQDHLDKQKQCLDIIKFLPFKDACFINGIYIAINGVLTET